MFPVVNINLSAYIIVCFDNLVLGDIRLNTVGLSIQLFTDLEPTIPVHWFHLSRSSTIYNKITMIF